MFHSNHVLGYYASREDYFTHERCGAFPGWKEGENWCGVDLHENGKVVYNNTEYSTHLFTKRAQKIVQDHNPDQVRGQKNIYIY